MLFSFRRLSQIVPILLIIVVAIIVTSYKDDILDSLRSSVEEQEESIPGKILGSVVDDVLPEQKDQDVNISDTIVVVTGESEYEVSIEIADSDEERIQGLMYRESLCDDCGMLFVFDDIRSGGFWMKDCEIPLDIIFIDEEEQIIAIKENFEPCSALPCPVYEPEHSYLYALEVNGGWVEGRSVKIGDHVEISE